MTADKTLQYLLRKVANNAKHEIFKFWLNLISKNEKNCIFD